jgi:serine carboxypeptidase-like clade IV
MRFCQAFFTEHPEFAENDFYITGESYAGHYIPAFASRVYQGNKNNEGIHINLKVMIVSLWKHPHNVFLCKALLFPWCNPNFIPFQGFAIGNGLTDPAIQYKAYSDYALDMGLITKSQYNRIDKIVPTCEFAVKLCGKSCPPALLIILLPPSLAELSAAKCFLSYYYY